LQHLNVQTKKNKMENGVTINGVTWATKNIGANSPEEMGHYLTWEEAKRACPEGWRLPTKEEFDTLKVNKIWTTLNGETGGEFFDENFNSIFLPGEEVKDDQLEGYGYGGPQNFYWSSTECDYNQTDARAFYFDDNKEVYPYTFFRRKSSRAHVRCVADKN